MTLERLDARYARELRAVQRSVRHAHEARSHEVAALLDHADVFDARLTQPRAGEQAAEPAADHRNIDVIRQWLASEARCYVRVFDEVRELALDLDVLLVAVFPQPLVTLRAILLAQRFRIECYVA